MPRIPKPARQLCKELEALDLSVEDVSRMFRASLRSVRSWTGGKTGVPNWLMPALRMYSLLPAEARAAVRESPEEAQARPRGSRPAASAKASVSAARHPFARIEEL